jgi:hypothetical protein
MNNPSILNWKKAARLKRLPIRLPADTVSEQSLHLEESKHFRSVAGHDGPAVAAIPQASW